MKTIALDMDGTIVDLYGVENWLESLTTHDVTPFVIAKPLVDTDRLAKTLKHLKSLGYLTKVITWLPKDSTAKFDKEVIVAKRNWLDMVGLLDHIDSIEYLPYGTSKARENTIMFDDDIRVYEMYQDVKSSQAFAPNLLKALMMISH